MSFDDGLSTEVDVNPEFGDTATARAVVDKYSDVIGRLPTTLRRNVVQVWIHQDRDGTFISTYARDNPTREDVAGSFLPYLAIRYRADRISRGMVDTIKATIPHRIDFLDQFSLDMHPIN